MSNKIIVLVTENPKHPTFDAVVAELGLYDGAVDPLSFLDKESHALDIIYKDVFTEDLANELLAYLVNKHPQDLVFDIINYIYGSNEKLILVNSTILSKEAEDFICDTFPTMAYTLTGNHIADATTIYEASKAFRDKLEANTRY